MIKNRDSSEQRAYQINVVHILLGVCSYFEFLAFCWFV